MDSETTPSLKNIVNRYQCDTVQERMEKEFSLFAASFAKIEAICKILAMPTPLFCSVIGMQTMCCKIPTAPPNKSKQLYIIFIYDIFSRYLACLTSTAAS